MTLPSNLAIDWPTVLQQHKPWLQKVLRSRVGDSHEVEDLFQEIALAVFRQSKTEHRSDGSIKPATVPSNPEKVAPWLYRLAVRQAVNFHRRSNRKSQAKPVAEIDPYSRSPQPLEWMLRQEQQTNMEHALGELRPQEREILALKYTERWTYRQIAERLGVPERTVEYRLLNARKALRKNLTRMGQDKFDSKSKTDSESSVTTNVGS